MTPDAIPPVRLRRYGVDDRKLAQYPGLKEEYYLADFEANPAVLEQLAIDSSKVLVVLRPPPDVSLYHRKSNPLFPQVVRHLGTHEEVRAVVLPRTTAQQEYVRSLNLPSLVVPDGAVDAQSLIAFADLVVSAGGTMNREAVALGTPVYTTYGGRLGGVDEALIREGRLRPLTDPRALELKKQSKEGQRTKRDPQLWVDLIIQTPR
jgi:predicted glycosyltransferase